MRHNPRVTARARNLRKAMSSAEVLLWSRLRGRTADKPRFRRQHPIGQLVVDFYCASARLVVEVDGRTHWDEEAAARDAARDAWLRRQDIEVMRIPAGSVYRDVDGVADAILLRADELSVPRLAPSTVRSAADGPPPPASRGS